MHLLFTICCSSGRQCTQQKQFSHEQKTSNIYIGIYWYILVYIGVCLEWFQASIEVWWALLCQFSLIKLFVYFGIALMLWVTTYLLLTALSKPNYSSVSMRERVIVLTLSVNQSAFNTDLEDGSPSTLKQYKIKVLDYLI